MVELPVVVEELSPRPSKELNLAAFPPITQDDSTCSDFNCSAWCRYGFPPKGQSPNNSFGINIERIHKL
ncbi:hypothetical protein V6N12_073677 [Hibiscus sabdariffa]|uniref:Uncharacterized protein n=1 Tax=Hibiscus sabdariffa TaxID=183260 RepID=A0ABR2CT56_9ROSI